eukprot:31681-Pyramimonas_sp.AAC.1
MTKYVTMVTRMARGCIRTIWEPRKGPLYYDEDDFKEIMERYIGRELQSYFRICAGDCRTPAGYMRI